MWQREPFVKTVAELTWDKAAKKVSWEARDDRMWEQQKARWKEKAILKRQKKLGDLEDRPKSKSKSEPEPERPRLFVPLKPSPESILGKAPKSVKKQLLGELQFTIEMAKSAYLEGWADRAMGSNLSKVALARREADWEKSKVFRVLSKKIEDCNG